MRLNTWGIWVLSRHLPLSKSNLCRDPTRRISAVTEDGTMYTPWFCPRALSHSEGLSVLPHLHPKGHTRFCCGHGLATLSSLASEQPLKRCCSESPGWSRPVAPTAASPAGGQRAPWRGRSRVRIARGRGSPRAPCPGRGQALFSTSHSASRGPTRRQTYFSWCCVGPRRRTEELTWAAGPMVSTQLTAVPRQRHALHRTPSGVTNKRLFLQTEKQRSTSS